MVLAASPDGGKPALVGFDQDVRSAAGAMTDAVVPTAGGRRTLTSMIDSHCHLADDAFAEDLEARHRPGAGRRRRAGAVHPVGGRRRRNRRRRRACGRSGRTCSSRSASTRTKPGSSPAGSTRHDVPACGSGSSRGRAGHRRDRPRLPLRLLAARRAAGRCSRPRSALALELALPVIIHTREATDDTFAILREAGGRASRRLPLLHRRPRMARAGARPGFYVSLAGIVTFPRADELREVARLVPADRLLIETDAPYLAPVPHRGKRNEPALRGRVVETTARRARRRRRRRSARRRQRNFAALLSRPWANCFASNGLAR